MSANAKHNMTETTLDPHAIWAITCVCLALIGLIALFIITASKK